MKLRLLPAALLAGGILLVACNDGRQSDTSQPTPPSTPSATSTPSSACPDQSDSIASAETIGGRIEGDIDGDGSADISYLVRDESGPPGCRNFLVVETADGLLSAPTSDPGTEYALQAPSVHSLVQVDGEEGLEILVNLEQGATTQFLGMFTASDGSLARVRFQEGGVNGDLFPYGGSVGHIEASNCTDTPGEVVIVQATPVAKGYRLERTLYELRDDVLVLAQAQPGPPAVVAPERLSLIDELAGSPFGACPRL